MYRLLQIHRHLDVFVSHDWPRGIANFGNKAQLFRAKPFLKREVIAALLWRLGWGGRGGPSVPQLPPYVIVEGREVCRGARGGR